jgi:alpha,alpha-trehalose-phosphate synthase [UDP-forming]
MRLLVRLLGGISFAVVLVTAVFAYLEVRHERIRLEQDLQRRAVLAADAAREASERLVARGARTGYERILARFGGPDRGVAIYDEFASPIAATSNVRSHLGPLSPVITEVVRGGGSARQFARLGNRAAWMHVVPLERDDRPIGAVAVFLDADYLDGRAWDLAQRTAVQLGVLILVVALITWVLVRWTVTRPIERIAEWTKRLKSGESVAPPPAADASLFGPLAGEVTGLARTLARARADAAQEARLGLLGERVWTEERLKQFVQMRFGTRPVFVVSNREPVSHVFDGKRITEMRPASGLVSALEPIMVACGGVWVAHGSGDADRVAGERVGLPSDDPSYTLRRIWLTAEEEAGHYYGFSNEGMWPLCHIVHERPQFRAADWEHYRAVNQRFADVLVEEMEKAESPIVLVQDYHFALLPRMIKQARPDAHVALFWHIPWPNVEAFGICPWQEEILLGMLGADLVGFHTQIHCNNFLETVERMIEARVEWDDFTAVRGQRTTHVLPFPISIAVDEDADERVPTREAWLAQLGLGDVVVGVGVERLDYTKGLPERLAAIRRFFERWPEYRGRVVFVQIASPSRSRIERYQRLQREVREAVKRINDDLSERGWRPIVYRERHHDRQEINTFYRHADFCLVTALHDGMNLVAKEYVGAREDDSGVLVLSRFTGACRELRDALMVNPYDIEGTAEAIRAAVEMSAEEQSERMARMRSQVREHNIYRWAALLLSELGKMSQSFSLLRG